METFKAWKELIKAVKGISSAIEGENSEGSSAANDNTNYLIDLAGQYYGLVNKNLDSTKLAFDVGEQFTPTKLGDIFTQEGIDIINSMLSNEFIKTNQVSVFIFAKDIPNGDWLEEMMELKFDGSTNKYIISMGLYRGDTIDEFTVDTPMSRLGQG